MCMMWDPKCMIWASTYYDPMALPQDQKLILYGHFSTVYTKHGISETQTGYF
jgi:hypothetical protein